MRSVVLIRAGQKIPTKFVKIAVIIVKNRNRTALPIFADGNIRVRYQDIFLALLKSRHSFTPFFPLKHRRAKKKAENHDKGLRL